VTPTAEEDAPREQLVLSVRRHGRVLVLPVLLLLVLAPVSGFFVGRLPEQWMNWAAALGAVAVALLLCIGPVLGWLVNKVTITSRRVIVRSGFFVHRRSEVPLSRVREVRMKRGPVQQLFRSGDIELMVGADTPLVLRDRPGPVVIVDALQELIEKNFLQAQTDAADDTRVVPPRRGGEFQASVHD
jgi:membrane protein YdbS with pleckstrin-like domain